jgi:hypothetical protein
VIDQSISVIGLLLAAAAFFGVFYGPWQSYCAEVGRFALFELRNKLYDLGHTGEWDMSSPEYKIIISQIDGMVARAHQFTVFGAIFMLAEATKANSGSTLRMFQVVSAIDDPVLRSKVQMILRDVVAVTFVFLMMRRSLILIGLFPISRLFSSIRVWYDSLGRLAVASFERELDRHESPGLESAW